MIEADNIWRETSEFFNLSESHTHMRYEKLSESHTCVTKTKNLVTMCESSFETTSSHVYTWFTHKEYRYLTKKIRRFAMLPLPKTEEVDLVA
jgi:hypothetical protein